MEPTREPPAATPPPPPADAPPPAAPEPAPAGEPDGSSVAGDDVSGGAPDDGSPPNPDDGSPSSSPDVSDLLFGEDAPSKVRVHDGRDESFSISDDELKAILDHPDVGVTAQHVISNFRNTFLRKTQELADERKGMEETQQGLDAQRAELEKMQTELVDARAKILALFSHPDLQKYTTPPDMPEDGPPDQFTPEGQEFYLKTAVAEGIKEFLDGFQAITEKEQKAIEEAKATAAERAMKEAQEQRKAQVIEFIKNTPDFEEYREDIKKIVQESGGSIPAERAYLMAKGERLMAEQQKLSPMERAQREARHSLKRPPTTRVGAVIELPPPGLSPKEQDEWFNEHPEARKALMEKIRAPDR